MISVEILNIFLHRIDAVIAANASKSYPVLSQDKTSATNTPVKDKDVTHTPKGSKTTTNHLQKLAAKPLEVKERVATDFFGRVLKVDPSKQNKQDGMVTSDVWFKFKGGYSNAVRRNVKMKDLM